MSCLSAALLVSVDYPLARRRPTDNNEDHAAVAFAIVYLFIVVLRDAAAWSDTNKILKLRSEDALAPRFRLLSELNSEKTKPERR